MSAADNELLRKARAGDAVATQQLLLRQVDVLTRSLEARIPADLRAVLSAEDICQETLVAAIRELPAFEPRGDHALRNWLLTIADRKLIDAIRVCRADKRGGGWQALAAGGRSETSAINLLERLAETSHTPSRSAVRHEAVDAVRAAVERLEADYRDVLRFRFVQGLSVAETAKSMQRSPGAVMMLCQRAVQRLAEQLADAGLSDF